MNELEFQAMVRYCAGRSVLSLLTSYDTAMEVMAYEANDLQWRF